MSVTLLRSQLPPGETGTFASVPLGEVIVSASFASQSVSPLSSSAASERCAVSPGM